MLIEPGRPGAGDDHAAADVQPVRRGHRIRVDVSSSNFPRLDVNPNTGEPIGRHTHMVVAEQTVFADAERPSHIVLPVIPRGT